MSYLNSAVAKRRLALFCVRLLLQGAMASWTPEAGMDEPELRYALGVDGVATCQPVARNERHRPVAPRSPA
jgi:hypothetical protein